MFAIDYFASKKRIINNIEDERGNLGTQSRIYDYNTGIYTRILPHEGKYNFTGAGITGCGIFYNMYGFDGVLEDDELDTYKLMDAIESNINELKGLSSNEVNFIIQNGFLEFLAQRNVESTKQKGFQTLLRTERILKQFEDDGKIEYNEVLQEINRKLNSDNLNEEDRKIFEQLKYVYKDEMFRERREGNELIEGEKKRRSVQHTLQEISEDLGEIGRSSSKENALKEITEVKETEIKMTDYGFNEDGSYEGIPLEEVLGYYETFKDEFDSDGYPLADKKSEYEGTIIAEIMYNYTRYLKAKEGMGNKEDEIEK